MPPVFFPEILKSIELPPTPRATTGHCLVAVDADTLFISGGVVTSGPINLSLRSRKEMEKLSETAAAYIYTKSNDSWTRVADMPTPRGILACGALINPDTGETEIVVAGGFFSRFVRTQEHLADYLF